MAIREMPAFVLSHKHVRNAVLYCLASCICLIAQFFLMDKNAIRAVFDVIIPLTAAVCFGCYAITMAMDRPILLICPTTVYFVSLLLYQLISVEVGVKDTYPFITLLEMIPFAFFSVSAATGKLKKITDIILRIFGIGLIIASLVLVILAVFFRIVIFINTSHYISNTFAMMFSFLAIVFIYCAMIELIKIAGCEKRVRIKRTQNS